MTAGCTSSEEDRAAADTTKSVRKHPAIGLDQGLQLIDSCDSTPNLLSVCTESDVQQIHDWL